MRFLLLTVLLSFPCFDTMALASDADHDGLTDELEAQLLAKFEPTFLLSAAECDVAPASFVPGVSSPRVLRKDGTIYGQAFRANAPAGDGSAIELHYYHLWGKDCGRMGHTLDVEHVSVLLKAAEADSKPEDWTAQYWYAGAHEGTACDSSQVAPANTLHATHSGANVWISAGKHASYLSEAQCRHSCGADQCDAGRILKATSIVNLGEANAPLEGSTWAASAVWSLAIKMRTDFPDARVQRIQMTDGLTEADERIPSMRAVIGAGATSFRAIDTGNRETGNALTSAKQAADRGLLNATASTKSALKRAHARVASWINSALPPTH